MSRRVPNCLLIPCNTASTAHSLTLHDRFSIRNILSLNGTRSSQFITCTSCRLFLCNLLSDFKNTKSTPTQLKAYIQIQLNRFLTEQFHKDVLPQPSHSLQACHPPLLVSQSSCAPRNSKSNLIFSQTLVFNKDDLWQLDIQI